MSATASIPIIRPDDYSATTHPGDLLSRRQRLVYVLVLGALTALGPFTVDLYLPAFPVLQDELGVSAAAVQLTLTGTMVGFGFGQLIVGPWSDKVGRRLPTNRSRFEHSLRRQDPSMFSSGRSRCPAGESAPIEVRRSHIRARWIEGHSGESRFRQS